MSVLTLIAETHRQVPTGAPPGSRCKLGAPVGTGRGRLEVTVAVRVDAQGQRREQFWCDGVRVERSVLLRLTCTETECPHAVAVHAQWQAFHARRHPATRATRPSPARPLMAGPLITDVPIQVGGQQIVARPASFPCFTPCPHHAHPPLTIHKRGFDLFEADACLAGGVTETRGVCRPRIPDLRAAEAFVVASRLVTMAALTTLGAPTGRDDPGHPESA